MNGGFASKFWALAASVCLAAFALTACSSSSKTNSSSNSSLGSTATGTTKSAFCTDDIKLDQASADAQSLQDALNALKANKATVDDMQTHLPPGTVGKEAKQLLDTAQQAIAKNDPNVLNDLPSNTNYGGDVDTYCGVDTNGDPLPAYFAKGKGSALCNADNTLSNGSGNAPDAAGALQFLKSHQSDINTFAAGVPSLPSSIKADAQTVLSQTRAAISSNDPSGLQDQTFQDAASNVDLYCGLNQ